VRTGKTRLSLQVAADLVETFPQGVWFVELTAVESPDEIMPAIAEALRFKIDATSNLAPRQQVIDFLSRRSCLLVLDNFEHLIEGAGLLTELIQHAPDVRLLVTTRERLNLREEWIFDVGGMSYPQNGRDRNKVYSGLHLFKERAQQVDDEFVLSSAVEPHAVRICQLMDGSPLGIELSAAWVATLPCSEIVREIEKSLDFVVTAKTSKLAGGF